MTNILPPESWGKHAWKCKKWKLSEIVFFTRHSAVGANLEGRIACKDSIICVRGS
jgi:hypothetical protein